MQHIEKTPNQRPVWHLWSLFSLLTGVAATLYQSHAYDTVFQQAEQHLLQLTSQKKAAIEQHLNRSAQTLEAATALAALAPAPSIKPSLMSERFEELVAQDPSVTTLVWMNAEGTVVASNRMTLLGNNFKDSERYTTISGHPGLTKVYLSEPFVTPLGKFTVSLGKMIPDRQGAFNGYVLAIVSPMPLLEVLQADTARYDVAAALVHDSGKVVFRMPDSDGRMASD